MRYGLIFPASYLKREKAFLKRHPEIQPRYCKTLLLLEANPRHPSLRLHALRGQLQSLHSVSISMKYRITLELEIRERKIVFIDIGSHGRIYRN
jgi:proteic killer suppression protein